MGETNIAKREAGKRRGVNSSQMGKIILTLYWYREGTFFSGRTTKFWVPPSLRP